jgi:hypothetical protein
MKSRFGSTRMLLILAVLILSVANRADAIAIGMVDDFEAGTTSGWGGGAPTANAPDAGPAGIGDNALSVNVTGGRVAVVNTAQWTGDFNTAGVTRILVDVRHQNAFNLQLRLGMAGGSVGPGGSGDTYVSAAAVPVASDGLWHRIALSLSAADLIPHAANSNPAPNAAAALSNVSHLRILHNSAANFLGATGPATFFLDNIRAVPEPTGAAIGSLAFGALSLSRRNRR